MKTTISLPDPVFRSAEQLANRPGLSRNELYCLALKNLLARHDQSAVTEQLDAVYGVLESNSSLDPGLAAMQSRTLKRHAGR